MVLHTAVYLMYVYNFKKQVENSRKKEQHIIIEKRRRTVSRCFGLFAHNNMKTCEIICVCPIN